MDQTLTRDRSRWQTLFEEISMGRRHELLTIDVLDEDFGDQIEADNLTFESLDFDDRSDVIIVALAARGSKDPVVLRHMIKAPQSVDLLDRPDSSLVMRVVDAKGVETLLTFQP